MWVTDAEIQAIAAEIEMDAENFEDQYIRKIGIRKSLKEFPNGDCFLFDNQTRKCTVYAARPQQCKTWPFWDSNLQSPDTWAETCAQCPGSGKGKLYQLEEIEQQRKQVKL